MDLISTSRFCNTLFNLAAGCSHLQLVLRNRCHKFYLGSRLKRRCCPIWLLSAFLFASLSSGWSRSNSTFNNGAVIGWMVSFRCWQLMWPSSASIEANSDPHIWHPWTFVFSVEKKFILACGMSSVSSFVPSNAIFDPLARWIPSDRKVAKHNVHVLHWSIPIRQLAQSES